MLISWVVNGIWDQMGGRSGIMERGGRVIVIYLLLYEAGLTSNGFASHASTNNNLNGSNWYGLLLIPECVSQVIVFVAALICYTSKKRWLQNPFCKHNLFALRNSFRSSIVACVVHIIPLVHVETQLYSYTKQWIKDFPCHQIDDEPIINRSIWK